MPPRHTSFALSLAFAAVSSAADLTLLAGVSKIEITPSSLLPMYGYANRKCGPANGTHDPLFAKALVLAAGDSRLAIVTLDAGNIRSENVLKEAAGRLHIPVVLLAASHTHSGPMPQDNLAELEPKILKAIEQASASLSPARLSFARGNIRLGYNRLQPTDDGRFRAVFNNLERIPYGPVDPEFILMRVEDLSGAPRALLVHYATHAVVLGPTNCKYSADYPGVLQARVEAAMPGAQCMFVQGGAGDINPLFMGRTGKEEEDFATTTKMGENVAAAVLRAAKEMTPAAPVRYPIQHISETLKFADRWDKSKNVEVGITTVLINREIAIAAIPGEPMHKLQKYWKTMAEVPYPLFYGYTYSAGGEWAGYIPDLRTAAHGGYGADVTTRIEIGAGETIMQHHLINLYRMLGMWREQPGRP